MSAEIRTQIDKFNKYLEQVSPKEDEKLIERLEMLQVLLSKSGTVLADAKYLRDSAVQEAIKGVISNPDYVGMTATVINEYVKTAAKDYNFLVNSLDRINSAAGQQIRAIISILSYRKSQMLL